MLRIIVKCDSLAELSTKIQIVLWSNCHEWIVIIEKVPNESTYLIWLVHQPTQECLELSPFVRSKIP